MKPTPRAVILFGDNERRTGADQSMEARIGSKVDASAGPGGCWYYGNVRKGYAWVRPYGRKGADRGESVMVHRYLYTMLVQRVPEGHHLHHTCERKYCVNPYHLIPVTPAEHSAIHADLRRQRKGAA